MRHVQVVVHDDERDAILDVLNSESIDFVVTGTAPERDDTAVIEFPLPAQAVETILDRLREAGLREEYLVISSAETARTEHIDDLEDRFVAGDEDDDSVAPEEIRSKALGLNPDVRTYYAMTILSAIVATVGLLVDSPVLVVGSMVIAPQVGAAMTASVGVVLSDREMTSSGLRSQLLGIAVAITGAAIFGVVLRQSQLVPPMLEIGTIQQVSERTSPGFLSLAVGLAAGAAGAFCLATALPVSLVGVMVAAALIPAAAAIGIGIAWSLPTVALGAFVLLVVNLVSINLASVGVLRYLGYRPFDADNEDNDDNEGEEDEDEETASVVTALRLGTPASMPARPGVVLAILGLLVVGASSGLVLAEHSSFENATNRKVQDVLASPAYDQLDLLEVDVTFSDLGLFDRPRHVQVTVSRPADEPIAELARTIGRRVETHTGESVVVELRLVERQRYAS